MRLALFAIGLAISGPVAAQDFGQPAEERTAQDELPKSKDALWATLAEADVAADYENGLFTIKTTPAIDALAGTTLTVSGFMVPLDVEENISHFLIARNTPVCPFCPPGEPDEVIEVQCLESVPSSYDLVTVTGIFKLIDNGDQGLFFQLKDARVKGD